MIRVHPYGEKLPETTNNVLNFRVARKLKSHTVAALPRVTTIPSGIVAVLYYIMKFERSITG